MDISRNNTYLLINNVIAGQTPKVIDVFYPLLKQFDLIIEIGSGRGAFSYWLHSNSKKFVSYDIDSRRNMFTDKNIDFRVGDCFDKKILSDIQMLIESHKRILLLCDGGNKEKEFQTFAKFLKKDDVIMCHDYSDCDTYYKKLQKDINWKTRSESHYKNILNTINLYNLEAYEYESCKNVLWGSFIKL